MSLAVFFAWHAALKPLTALATDHLPDVLGNAVQYVVVGATAWVVESLAVPMLWVAMAVGGLVALANVIAQALRAYADAANPPVTIRRDGRPQGFR